MRETSSSSAAAAAASSASNNNDNNNDSDPSPASPSVLAAAAATSSSASSTSIVPVSVSDLVPFVASVLRDRAMQDLQTEYEALKEEVKRQQEAQLRVEITGRDGNPVYCQTSMQYGVDFKSAGGTPRWHLFFDDNHDGTNTIIPNFTETVEGLELRLSGNVVFRFDEAIFTGPFEEDGGFDRTRDDVAQMGKVCFIKRGSHGEHVYLLGRVGPIRYHDFMNMLPQEELTVPDWVIFLNANRNPQEVLLQEMEISSVVFSTSRITGILALLKSMGIATE